MNSFPSKQPLPSSSPIDHETGASMSMNATCVCGLVNALTTSSLRPWHFPAGVALAAAAFRRIAAAYVATAANETLASPASFSVFDAEILGKTLTTLTLTLTHVPDAAMRERARLALSRALSSVPPTARFDAIQKVLRATPPPSPAVTALLLSRVKREAAAAGDAAAGNTRDLRDNPFSSAVAVDLVTREVTTALRDATRGAADPAGAADVAVAGLNALRFFLMRGAARGPDGDGDDDDDDVGERGDGAWERREEIVDAVVRPASTWATAELARRRVCGGEGDDEIAVASLMALQQVESVAGYVLEFVEQQTSS